MLPRTKFIIEAVRKASRFIARDYSELEYLQNSTQDSIRFVDRARTKATDTLSQELLKYPNAQIIKGIDAIETKDPRATYYIINAIDSPQNMMRAIPFFGTSVLCYQYRADVLVAAACVLHFPAMSETVYSEIGAGAWCEKGDNNVGHKTVRLRVSRKTDDTALTITNASQYICDYLATKPQECNLRSFGSELYSIYLVASGKADIYAFPSSDKVLEAISRLMIVESGGTICDHPKYTGYSIATNGIVKVSV